MVSQLSTRLQQRGWRVGVVCTLEEGELVPALRAAGISVDLLTPLGLGAWFGESELTRLLRRWNPSVVHTHSGFWLRGVVAASRAGVPGRVHTVHGLHQPEEPWWGPVEKYLSGRLTGAVVSVAPQMVEYLAHQGRVPRSRLHQIPNGIDVPRFASAPRGTLREDLGISPHAVVLGTVARIAPIKNLGLPFGSLARLVATGHDAHWVIAGDGPDRAELAATAAAAGIGDRVHFLGMVDDPSTVLPDFDIFLNTSHSEGTSLSVLEAMASGIPCVATSVGGNPEVLADGAAGRLVPPNDPIALADTLAELLANPEERRRLGAEGQRRAEERYSLTAMVDAYESLYDRLMNGHG